MKQGEEVTKHREYGLEEEREIASSVLNPVTHNVKNPQIHVFQQENVTLAALAFMG